MNGKKKMKKCKTGDHQNQHMCYREIMAHSLFPFSVEENGESRGDEDDFQWVIAEREIIPAFAAE